MSDLTYSSAFFDRFRLKRTEILFNADQGDAEFDVPLSLSGAILWLQNKLALVPHEYRDAATIEFNFLNEDWETSNANLVISYLRPETDAEVAERISREQINARITEAEERAQYEALRVKYG